MHMFCFLQWRCASQPNQTTGEGKLFDLGENLSCPVRMFENYTSKLNPKCEALWQRSLE